MNDISMKRRMKNVLLCAVIIFGILVFRVGWIQFINGEELQTLAYEQQTLDRKINPKRWTIFDRDGNELAVSSTVYTVTINPTNIKDENKEKVAKAISDIFELDYEKILKKVKKRSSIETVAKKQEKDIVDKLSKWIIENKIETGINIDEDTKRYYPYNTLASLCVRNVPANKFPPALILLRRSANPGQSPVLDGRIIVVVQIVDSDNPAHLIAL